MQWKNNDNIKIIFECVYKENNFDDAKTMLEAVMEGFAKRFERNKRDLKCIR